MCISWRHLMIYVLPRGRGCRRSKGHCAGFVPGSVLARKFIFFQLCTVRWGVYLYMHLAINTMSLNVFLSNETNMSNAHPCLSASCIGNSGRLLGVYMCKFWRSLTFYYHDHASAGLTLKSPRTSLPHFFWRKKRVVSASLHLAKILRLKCSSGRVVEEQRGSDHPSMWWHGIPRIESFPERTHVH